MSRAAAARGAKTPESVLVAGGMVVVVAGVAGVALGLERINFDVIVGVMTLLCLVLLSIPAFRYVSRAERDPGVLPILYAAMAAKIVGTLVRYFFITVIYNDNGDAGVYSQAGAIFMQAYRQGIFSVEVAGLSNRGAETARIAMVVGFVYLVTGVSRYAASFVFSWMCLTGQVLMYRAFKRGVPEGDHRRYSYLVLLLPSMLFWPSSIGKEALMVFFIGLVCYGAAQLLGPRVRLWGLLVFAAGAAGLLFIRPHMALIAITALGFAAAVGTIVGFTGEIDKKAKSRAFVVRLVALVVLVGGGVMATTQVSKVLGDGTEGAAGITGVLARTQAQTAEGGSKFNAVAVTNPTQLPAAAVTVLFRPFPWESRNLNGVIASAEGVLLASLMIVGRRRLLSWVKFLGRRPYLVFCLAYAMTFIVAFSYIGNFGILARQRTQMMPLAVTLLGMPAAARARSGWFGGLATRSRSESADDDVPAPVVDAVGAHGPLHPGSVLTPRVQSGSVRSTVDQIPQGDAQR